MTNILAMLCCVVLLACFNLSTCSIANLDYRLNLSNIKRDQSKISSMMFRSKIYRKQRLGKNDIEKIMQLLKSLDSQDMTEDPWTLKTVGENSDLNKRSHTHYYTPRLGGRNSEQSHLSHDEGVGERSPPFSPSLGPRLKNQYSPRLGRDDGMVYL